MKNVGRQIGERQLLKTGKGKSPKEKWGWQDGASAGRWL